MDKRTSLTFDDALTNETSRVIHRHANARMVQDVLLIWLDSNINEDDDTDCRNTIAQLRHVIRIIKTFTDPEKCIRFINNMKDENICIMISGSLGPDIVPCIHDMSHIDSIFIFCGNKTLHLIWTKEWSKIKGVCTEVSPICKALKQTVEQYEESSISMNFVPMNTDASKEIFDKIHPSFIFTQILKEIILTTKLEENHIKQFLDYSRNVLGDNENELKNVVIFERKYHDLTPIWWYTYECFLYPMLSRGLRMMDMNIISKMSFFINDLHYQIGQLHQEQFNQTNTDNIFTVYHGQGLSKSIFEQIKKTKSGFISFNHFVCTSKDRRISIDFAQRAVTNPDLVGIFFVMTIDPCKSTTPFAFINSISRFQGKDEVLFPIHTVFRIREIQSMGENNRLFQVDLTLTSDNDGDLRVLTNRIRDETFPEAKGWDRLGQLLIKMNHFDKAQQIYNILFEQTTNESDKGNIYYQLGKIKDNQKVYKEAITYYEKSIDIYQKSLPSNQHNLAASYDGLGSVYDKMNEYSKALHFYEKALEIWQKIYPPNHPDLAAIHKKIALVRYKTGNDSKILPFSEHAVSIGQEPLPSNQSHIDKWLKNFEFFIKKL